MRKVIKDEKGKVIKLVEYNEELTQTEKEYRAKRQKKIAEIYGIKGV